MTRTLALVREFRKEDDETPVVLMGYYNPIYIYGNKRFLVDAKATGVDGLIVVDLPPEEDEELCLPALKTGLNFIRLATPTTDDKRLPTVLTNTSGFVYYVSITGITGASAPDTSKVTAAVARIKRHTKVPVAVGFGVKNVEQARAIAEGADGVVVGSALVDTLRQSLDANGEAGSGTVEAVTGLVSTLAQGVHADRRVTTERTFGQTSGYNSAVYGRPINWVSKIVQPKNRKLLSPAATENRTNRWPEKRAV